MIANVLSYKSTGSQAHITVEKRPLVSEMHNVFQPRTTTEMVELNILITHFQVQSLLRDGTVTA